MKIENKTFCKTAKTELSTINENFIIELYTSKNYQGEVNSKFTLYQILKITDHLISKKLCEILLTIKHESTKRLTENKLKQFHNEALKTFNVDDYQEIIRNRLNINN